MSALGSCSAVTTPRAARFGHGQERSQSLRNCLLGPIASEMPGCGDRPVGCKLGLDGRGQALRTMLETVTDRRCVGVAAQRAASNAAAAWPIRRRLIARMTLRPLSGSRARRWRRPSRPRCRLDRLRMGAAIDQLSPSSAIRTINAIATDAGQWSPAATRLPMPSTSSRAGAAGRAPCDVGRRSSRTVVVGEQLSVESGRAWLSATHRCLQRRAGQAETRPQPSRSDGVRARIVRWPGSPSSGAAPPTCRGSRSASPASRSGSRARRWCCTTSTRMRSTCRGA